MVMREAAALNRARSPSYFGSFQLTQCGIPNLQHIHALTAVAGEASQISGRNARI